MAKKVKQGFNRRAFALNEAPNVALIVGLLFLLISPGMIRSKNEKMLGRYKQDPEYKKYVTWLTGNENASDEEVWAAEKIKFEELETTPQNKIPSSQPAVRPETPLPG